MLTLGWGLDSRARKVTAALYIYCAFPHRYTTTSSRLYIHYTCLSRYTGNNVHSFPGIRIKSVVGPAGLGAVNYGRGALLLSLAGTKNVYTAFISIIHPFPGTKKVLYRHQIKCVVGPARPGAEHDCLGSLLLSHAGTKQQSRCL